MSNTPRKRDEEEKKVEEVKPVVVEVGEKGKDVGKEKKGLEKIENPENPKLKNTSSNKKLDDANNSAGTSPEKKDITTNVKRESGST